MVDKALTSAITEKQDTAVETTWAAGKKDNNQTIGAYVSIGKIYTSPPPTSQISQSHTISIAIDFYRGRCSRLAESACRRGSLGRAPAVEMLPEDGPQIRYGPLWLQRRAHSREGRGKEGKRRGGEKIAEQQETELLFPICN